MESWEPEEDKGEYSSEAPLDPWQLFLRACILKLVVLYLFGGSPK